MMLFLPSMKSHLNSESPVLVYIQLKTASLKIALMTHAKPFPRNRLWLNSVWSHPSILIWCTGVLGSGASNVCFFLPVTQPHRELMPPALISQSEEGDWLFNCSCFFKILVFFWLYSSNGKLPWQIKNHLLRFLLCFWCVMAWARVSLDEGLGPSDAASCHATVHDLEWDPKLLGFIFFVLKMRGMNLLMKGCFSSQRHDDEMLCFSTVHWNFSPSKRAFGKNIMRLLGKELALTVGEGNLVNLDLAAAWGIS